ncbi:MAG: single-stranded DNA-binding protein [Nocardioides sp.]
MNESLVTLQGWLGSDVTVRQAGESTVATFRLGCTPRRYSKKSESWVDGETQWYSVNAWRALADHCAGSLRRGDPVVVFGRLNVEIWTNKAGIEVSSLTVDATFVGHDLNRGTSQFTKSARSEQPTPTQPASSSSEVAPEGVRSERPAA